MRKKSFTLIEVLISITIFAFVFFAMSSIISYLTQSKEFIKSFYTGSKSKERSVNVLYEDFLKSSSLKIREINKNVSELKIYTYNSLYELPYSFVIWKLNSSGELVREEFIEYDKKVIPFVDNFGKVEIFRVFKKNDSFFVFIRFDKKHIYFFKSIVK